jgi:hypothetical protein
MTFIRQMASSDRRVNMRRYFAEKQPVVVHAGRGAEVASDVWRLSTDV